MKFGTLFFYIFSVSMEEAQTISKDVLTKTDNFPNWIEWHVFYFYHALTLTALIKNPSQSPAEWKVLLKDYKLIKRWAKGSPVNYDHHEKIIRAEILRIKGLDGEALKTYEMAIEASKKNGTTQDIAVAYELLGKFHIANHSPELASFFFSKFPSILFTMGR